MTPAVLPFRHSAPSSSSSLPFHHGWRLPIPNRPAIFDLFLGVWPHTATVRLSCPNGRRTHFLAAIVGGPSWDLVAAALDRPVLRAQPQTAAHPSTASQCPLPLVLPSISLDTQGEFHTAFAKLIVSDPPADPSFKVALALLRPSSFLASSAVACLTFVFKSTIVSALEATDISCLAFPSSKTTDLTAATDLSESLPFFFFSFFPSLSRRFPCLLSFVSLSVDQSHLVSKSRFLSSITTFAP